MESYGWRLGTGFLSTPFILNILAEIDIEAAYKLLENEFVLAPKPGGHFTYAKAEYNSVYGKVSCGWKKQEDGNYHYEMVVPANTTAKVMLPDGRKMICKAGKYEF